MFLVPVVAQAHVVTQFMRKCTAPTSLASEAEGTIAVRDTANVTHLEQQVHEVGPGSVADNVDLVHMAVRPIRETVKIEGRIARLRVLHLGSGHKRHSVAHAARLVGLVRLGDHQVDHRLDRGSAAGPRAGTRRIEDRHVDRNRFLRATRP